MAVFAQYIPLLASVEDEIVKFFRNGGGVSYSKYTRFHEIMAEDSGLSVLSSLETHIIPLVPGLHDPLLKGIRVLDVGCKRGRILDRLAALYPKSLFVGMDLSQEAITYAQKEALTTGHDNVDFNVIDLSNFDQTTNVEAYDFITTFDAIHDQSKPLNVLKGIHRSLKPNGVYMMQDISGSSHIHKDMEYPNGTLMHTISCMR